jgi:uncharacterized protein YdaU (DUF1376 family)
MHYYQFNIGDYRKDTSHLSMLEHGIYRTLLDWYYLDEKPIPKETQVVSRRLRLASESDSQALKNVLFDFFQEREDGFHHLRCDMEIAEYTLVAEKNRENGKKGGRPKANKHRGENPVGSHSDNLVNPNQSQNNPNQEPINQEPVIYAAPKGTAKAKRLSPDWQLPKAWGEWTLENMAWGESSVRLEAEKFKDYWIAKGGREACKLDWEATWRNWCRSAKVQTGQAGGSLLVGGI